MKKMNMRNSIKIIVLITLLGLFSCEELRPKEYKLHARSSKQERVLNSMLTENNGVYKVQMDSLQHILKFKYSERNMDLNKLEDFFAKNDLINTDTTAVIDTTYLIAERKRLKRLDSIKIVNDKIKEHQSIIDSIKELAPKIEEEEIIIDSIINEDSIISPVADIPFFD